MSRHASSFHEVETSPDGRYVRFDEQLGTGAYKSVYLAYDTETGKEVAWNTVAMKRLPVAEQRRIRMETSILSRLHHPHVINFYDVWVNEAEEEIWSVRHDTPHTTALHCSACLPLTRRVLVCCCLCSFATEIMTSGTLKQYTSRLKAVKVKVIKKWSASQHYKHPLEMPEKEPSIRPSIPHLPVADRCPMSPSPACTESGAARSCLRWCICTRTPLPSSTAT